MPSRNIWDRDLYRENLDSCRNTSRCHRSFDKDRRRTLARVALVGDAWGGMAGVLVYLRNSTARKDPAF